LAVGLIPAVWVPPRDVRELRALVSHRHRVISHRTQVRHRWPSLLQRHHLVPPGPEPFGPAHRAWWSALALPASEHLRLRHQFAVLDALEPLIAEVDRQLERQSTIEPWTSHTACLVQLPGIGVLTAMVVLRAIGNICRFPSAKQLVGFGARVHDSGQTHRIGGITKQGRGDLRGGVVEAAWVAVRTHPHWRAVSEHLAHRQGSGQAIVTIARNLLVVVWHVVTERVADRQADIEVVARTLMTCEAWRGVPAAGGRR
jgi:transposase